MFLAPKQVIRINDYILIRKRIYEFSSLGFPLMHICTKKSHSLYIYVLKNVDYVRANA